ncbi:MAG: transposase [Planctomycetaceae bacterium]|nr:transposase [Planctomycetaceae bacterium]
MANSYTSLTYHIVFSTRLRRALIRDEIKSEVHQYIAGIIRENRGQPLDVGGVEDHVHILTGIQPTIAVSDMVRLIKTNSSKWFNEKHVRNIKFGWQTGYAAFTVSQSQSSFVRDYVRTQREHHRTLSFHDEYLTLLRKHENEFDEQYVFDKECVA